MMDACFNLSEGYFFLVLAIELVLVTVLAIALTYIAEQTGPVPRAVVVLTERLELVLFLSVPIQLLLRRSCKRRPKHRQHQQKGKYEYAT